MDPLSHNPLAPGFALLGDADLLVLIQQGDRGASAALYERYADRLRAVLGSRRSGGSCYDSDDLLQSAFRVFFEGAGRGQYHAPSERDLWALLVTIVLNKQRSQARRAAVLRAPKRNGGPRPRAEDEPGVAFAARDILERLPSPEREIAELRLAGHAVEEIAQRLGRSRRTVERNLQACRKRLLEQVTTHE